MVLLAASLLFTFTGCALWDRLFGEKEKDAAHLMAEGLEAYQKGKFEEALQAFQKVKDRYPYSPQAVEAELKLADAYFAKGQLEEALDAYAEFEKLHPKHPQMPYVLYQKGMCHFMRITTIDRDPTPTLQAKEEFERLIKRFRKGLYVDMARQRLRKCLMDLAEYELYVARFYFKMGQYQTAINRCRHLMETYPDLGQYHEALELIGQSEVALREARAKEAEGSESSWWRRLLPSFLH